MGLDAAGQRCHLPNRLRRLLPDTTAITDGHNCPSILTEIALYRAGHAFYTVDDFPATGHNPGPLLPHPGKADGGAQEMLATSPPHRNRSGVGASTGMSSDEQIQDG
jgi:hypothetical protein